MSDEVKMTPFYTVQNSMSAHGQFLRSNTFHSTKCNYINNLKPNGDYKYHLLEHSTLHFPHNIIMF